MAIHKMSGFLINSLDHSFSPTSWLLVRFLISNNYGIRVTSTEIQKVTTNLFLNEWANSFTRSIIRWHKVLFSPNCKEIQLLPVMLYAVLQELTFLWCHSQSLSLLWLSLPSILAFVLAVPPLWHLLYPTESCRTGKPPTFLFNLILSKARYNVPSLLLSCHFHLWEDNHTHSFSCVLSASPWLI